MAKLIKRLVSSAHRSEETTRGSQRQNADHGVTTEKLRQSEERFQILIDSIQDYAIYILDPNGIVISWNSGAQRIKGYSAQEILGRHFSQFYTPDDNRINKANQNLEIAAAKGKYEGESLRVKKDGTLFWANVLITPFRDSFGKLTGFAKVVRDITERKASEQRLRESERLATLGTTAAVFAHEIANPLNGIASSLQLTSNLLDAAENQKSLLKETIDAANQEIGRLTSLLHDYRSLARPQTITRQPSNLRKIVEEVLAPNLKGYKNSRITLRLEFDEKLPLVPLDPEKIKQVIVNLCKNGIDAMPEGGLLTIRAYRVNGYVVLEISDIGQGIPEGFDPFHLFKTTKPEGTGLGLSIAQQIVSDHHGTVDFVSNLGKGTTFRVSLPIS